jgi:hypothetical protein
MNTQNLLRNTPYWICNKGKPEAMYTNAISRVIKVVKGSHNKIAVWTDVSIVHVLGEGNKKDPDYLSVKAYRQISSDKRWITEHIQINKDIKNNYEAAEKENEFYAWQPNNATLATFKFIKHTPESRPGQTPSDSEVRHIIIEAMF